MCKVEGCTAEEAITGKCAAHAILEALGFDLAEFARLTDGYSPAVIIRESVKRTLSALRKVAGEV